MTERSALRPWLRPWCLSRAVSAGLLQVTYSKPVTPFWDQGAHDWGQVSMRVELILGDELQSVRQLDEEAIAALFDGIETDRAVLAKFAIGAYRVGSAVETMLGISESALSTATTGRALGLRAIEASGWRPDDFGPRLHKFYAQCRQLGGGDGVREPCAVFITSVLPSARGEGERQMREQVLDGFLGVKRPR